LTEEGRAAAPIPASASARSASAPEAAAQAGAQAGAEAEAEAGIVQPVRSARSPVLAPRALLAATQADMGWLTRRVAPHTAHSRGLYTSRLVQTASERGELTLVGPLMGAPYAVMLLETLLAWGAREFLFLGWCGAIQPDLGVGDLVWAVDAHIDEGTSPSYGQSWQGAVAASGRALARRTAAVLKREGLALRQGRVWTTDAIFRETPAKVKHHQGAGTLAVEMEVSALYSAAAFHGASAQALLCVSDLLADLTWRPGFKNEAFNTNRQRLCAAALKICLEKDP
jgi:purine-nucleoside phosphorylase